jgi:hypothetical protein
MCVCCEELNFTNDFEISFNKCSLMLGLNKIWQMILTQLYLSLKFKMVIWIQINITP